jgi:hypothetical protein
MSAFFGFVCIVSGIIDGRISFQESDDSNDGSRLSRSKDTHHLAQCAMSFGLCVAELVLAQVVDGVEHCSAVESKDDDGQVSYS